MVKTEFESHLWYIVTEIRICNNNFLHIEDISLPEDVDFLLNLSMLGPARAGMLSS